LFRTCIEKWSHARVFYCEILPHGDKKKKEVANSTKYYFGEKFHQNLQYFEEGKS